MIWEILVCPHPTIYHLVAFLMWKSVSRSSGQFNSVFSAFVDFCTDLSWQFHDDGLSSPISGEFHDVFWHVSAFFDSWAPFIDKYTELNSDYISEAANTSGKSILNLFSLFCDFWSGTAWQFHDLNLFDPVSGMFSQFSVILTAFFDFWHLYTRFTMAVPWL